MDVELLRQALNGERGEDQKKIAEVGIGIVTTLLKKNRDYAGSAYQSPCLLQSLTPRQGIQVRMSDKIQRLQNLLKGNTAEVKESVEDSMTDLSGYAILWLTAPEDQA
jgi:hypothetical protein